MKDRIVLQNGRLPSKRDILFAKIGELLDANNNMASALDGKFQPNPNQQKLFDMIEHSEVPMDKWIHMLLFGPRGCLSEDTVVPFVIRDEEGGIVNKKGGTISRLYERFHRIRVGGKGKNRIVPLGYTFHLPSVDEATGIISTNRILDVIDNGVRQTYTLTTDSGRTIEATSNHPFLIPSGRYVPLGDLKPGDGVMVHANVRKEPYCATEEKVVNITPSKVTRVYDITMEAPHHNFPANGFFVHNSGKSIGAYAYTINCLTKYPGSRALGVRTTSTDIKDSIYGDCVKFLNRYGIPYTPNVSDTTLTLANGSVFRMRSDKALTDSHSDKSHALGSTSYNIVIFEEADSISQELAISMAGSMRHPGKFRKVIFYLCNPPSKRHWLWKMFHEGNDPYNDASSRRRALYCAAEDNVQHVGTGYVEAMREDFGMNPNLAKRLGYGLPGADVKGTPYFAQDFVKGIHVSEVPLVWNPAYPLQRGWDFGFEGMAMVVLQADPDLNQIRVFRAILEQQSLIDPFCDKWLPILEKDFPGAVWEDYGDPAGRQQTHRSAKTDFDVLKERGLRPKYSVSGVAWGLSVISNLLRTFHKGRPKLIISPEAELLVEAFEGGYCNMKGVTDTEPRPKKDGVYDHIFDAFRYIVVCLRQPSIEYVRGARAGYVSMAEGDDLFAKDLTRSNVLRTQSRGIQVPPRRGFGGSLLNG